MQQCRCILVDDKCNKCKCIVMNKYIPAAAVSSGIAQMYDVLFTFDLDFPFFMGPAGSAKDSDIMTVKMVHE